ncbi:MAG: family N-acetyltransferase [Thermoleophilia bacterium]|nr:family N-acetyltransferase [Thermoleophilia bacterium]
MRIRLGQLSEQAALEELQRRASLANEGDRAAILADPGMIVLPASQLAAGQVFVAEHAGVRVGFAAVLDRADGDTELDGLFVEPRSWRGGVGRQLVDRAVRYAEEHGAQALHVIGNSHAAGFYGACGFEHSGVEETAFGVSARLRMPLRSA